MYDFDAYLVAFLRLEKYYSPPLFPKKINIRNNPVDFLSTCLSICLSVPKERSFIGSPGNNQSDQTLKGGIGKRMHDKGRDWKGRS